MPSFKSKSINFSYSPTPIIPSVSGDVTVVSKNGKLNIFDGVEEKFVLDNIDQQNIYSTITSITGNLQSQITNLDSIYATDSMVANLTGNLQYQITNLGSVYISSSMVANISSNLQSQITNLDSIYATDSMVANLTGNLQTQINNLDSIYATDSMVANLTGNLQYQIDNFSGGVSSVPVTADVGNPIQIDFSESDFFIVNLSGSQELGEGINYTPGMKGIILIKQPSSGGKLLTFSSQWKFIDGVTPNVSLIANSVDMLEYYIEDSSNYRCKITKRAGTDSTTSRYWILLIGRPISGGGSVVREVKFYDPDDVAIPWTTTATGVYDDRNSPDGYYWTSGIWDRTNLHDDDSAYGSGSAWFGCYLGTGTESVRIRIDFGSSVTIKRWKMFMGAASGTSGAEKPYISRLYTADADPQTELRAGTIGGSWVLVGEMNYLDGVDDREQEFIL
jgi:hypothetical protein